MIPAWLVQGKIHCMLPRFGWGAEQCDLRPRIEYNFCADFPHVAWLGA